MSVLFISDTKLEVVYYLFVKAKLPFREGLNLAFMEQSGEHAGSIVDFIRSIELAEGEPDTGAFGVGPDRLQYV